MSAEIISRDLQLAIYGFGGIAMNRDYAGTAFKLSGKMWFFTDTSTNFTDFQKEKSG